MSQPCLKSSLLYLELIIPKLCSLTELQNYFLSFLKIYIDLPLWIYLSLCDFAFQINKYIKAK